MTIEAQATAIALRARRDAGLRMGDPASSVDVALRLGFHVRLLAVGSLEGLYRPGDPPMIVVGSERPRGRRNFTCAHELGHHFLGHGQRLDELHQQSEQETRDPTEVAADCFAAALLMPTTVVRSAFVRRGWPFEEITPIHAYVVAGELNVGYSTLIDRMGLSLRLLAPAQRLQLRRVRPKQIRERILGVAPPHDLVVVDNDWLAPVVDLELGDFVLVQASARAMALSDILARVERHRDGLLLEASRPGVSTIELPSGLQIQVRVSRRAYHGLADYRHLEDAGDE